MVRVQRRLTALLAAGWILTAGPLAATALATEEPPVPVTDTVTDTDADTDAESESADSAILVVERLHSGLLEAMQNADELGFQGRFDLIRPVVEQTFDLNFMGSKSVGRHWKKLTPEEQALWLDKFTGFLSANYAGNFDGFDGESFETLGEEPAKRETRVVLTELRVPSSEDVVLNYRLRDTQNGWRIIDIYLKGTVSELALRRSDFSSTLKQKGFGELAAAVDQKIQDLRNKGGG